MNPLSITDPEFRSSQPLFLYCSLTNRDISSYMTAGRRIGLFSCPAYLRNYLSPPLLRLQNGRVFTQTGVLPQAGQSAAKEEESSDKSRDADQSPSGRMSERLSQMTDESIEQGGKSAQKATGDAGFSEELKRRLEARIKDGAFKSENAAAFAEITMPVGILRCSSKVTYLHTTVRCWQRNASNSSSAALDRYRKRV